MSVDPIDVYPKTGSQILGRSNCGGPTSKSLAYTHNNGRPSLST